jgi:hypothetical protein
MSWLSNTVQGVRNPADSASRYLSQIPSQSSQYTQPFFEAGRRALPSLQQQYSSLLNNPGNKINDIGSQFQQSPGFNFALQQALQGANHGAAAGGMAGSPQHEQQNMELATNLGNQDYNNWLRNALGLYHSGLEGEEHLAGMGEQAGMNLSDMIAQTLAQQGNLAFQDQRQKNQNKNDLIGSAFKGIGSLAAFNPYHMFGNI